MRTTLILLVILTAAACKTTKKQNKDNTLENIAFVIPSAFTPNGDGENDEACFTAPKQTGTFEGVIEVYSRWGEVIWQTKNLGDCWNGENMKTKQPMPNGTYYVKIQQNGVEKLSGAITLIR